MKIKINIPNVKHSKVCNCFSKYYRGKNGLQAYCKECEHKTYIENRDKILEYNKNEYYQQKKRDRISEQKK